MELRCTKDLEVFPGLILVLMETQQPSGLKVSFQIQGSSVMLRTGTCANTTEDLRECRK